MSGLTNEDRANFAAEAVKAYAIAKADGESVSEVVTDLIADLMHLAEREGLDPKWCVRVAGDHYSAETIY